MNTKSASLIIGLLFIAVGILGFFPNPIIGESENVIFHADSIHNIVHITSGILFLIVALAAPTRSPFFLKAFGLVYLALGIIGFVTGGNNSMSNVLGFLHVNTADNYLHLALGAVIFLAGFLPARIPARSV